MKVIIDTNGLMIPAQFNVDIFDELIRIGYDDFIVPKAVIEELEILNKKAKGTDRTAAKIAKSLSGRCRLVDITGNADDVIEELAFEMDADVLTNDIELKKNLSAEEYGSFTCVRKIALLQPDTCKPTSKLKYQYRINSEILNLLEKNRCIRG